MASIASAVELNIATTYKPSQSNATYVINTTQTNITTAYVNETCLVIDNLSWCEVYTEPTTINLFAFVEPLQITNLYNTSIAYNQASLEWTVTDANTSRTYIYQNGTFIRWIASTSNTTTLTGLAQLTTYEITAIAWNAWGYNWTNSSENQFNITTPATTRVAGDKNIIIGYRNKFNKVNMDEIVFDCTPVLSDGVITECI